MERHNKTQQSLSHGIIKNISWNFFGQSLLLIISFFATPFIIHRLGTSLYGIYVLTAVVVGYFAFLDLGLGAATVKYISGYLAKNQEQEIGEIFWSSVFVYFLMGISGTAVIYFSAGFLVNNLFKIPQDLKPLAVFALKVCSFGLLISMLLGVISGIIRAANRFDILNKIGIVLGALQIGLTVVLLFLKFSIIEIIIASLMTQVLGVYLYWKYAKQLFPVLTKRPSWSLKVLFKLFKFGGFVTISGLMAPILSHIEKIFLSSLKPIIYLTYYSVPFSLVDRLSVIRSSFSSVLFPTFSYLDNTQKAHFNKELYFRSTLYMVFFYSFFVVFFVAFGRQFLALWLGGDFADRSTNILIILSFAGFVNAMASPALVVLQGVGKPHLPALFHLVEAVFYIPASYLFILKFGGTGAALAYFLRVLLDTFLLHSAACRFFSESIILWYSRLLRKSFLPLIVCVFPLIYLKGVNLHLLNPFNVCGILFVFVIYFIFVWKIGLDDFAREKFLYFLRNPRK